MPPKTVAKPAKSKGPAPTKASPDKPTSASSAQRPSPNKPSTPATGAAKGSSPPKSADPKAAAGGGAGAKGTGEKKGAGKGKDKNKGGKSKTGNTSDSDDASVGSENSNTSANSKTSAASNKSDKSKASAATKNSKSTTKSNLTEAKAVKEVTGPMLMSAVNDFDKKALTEYIDFHKEAGPLSESVINFTNNGGNTPLMMACQKPKDTDAELLVKMLLELRPTLNLNVTSRTGNTALHYACKDAGLPNTAALLLEAGAEFQTKNADGFMPSDLAKQPRIVQLLRHSLEMRLEEQRLAAIAEIGAPLYEAVATNDTKKLQVLINREPPEETYSWRPEPRDQNPTALRLAVDRNYLEIVRMLVAAGADGKIADRMGRTPTIHLCAQKRIPSYPTTKRSRDAEAVRWNLLQALMSLPMTHLECRDKNGETAFIHACCNGYYDDMRLLQECGADVNARQVSAYPYRGYPSQREKNGDTALILATRRGDMAVVQVLVEECKVDVNLHGAEGMTALMWAAWHDRKELIAYLHSKGAQINAQSYFGQTALMWTMEHMRIETGMFLLDLGYDEPEPVPEPVAPSKGGGKSGAGAKAGRAAKGKQEPPPPPPDPNKTPNLPPRAADPNVTTKNNATPLIVLCRKAKAMDPKKVSACIDLLVSRGANVDVRSTDGLTALMWAVINNDKDVCRQLLFVGANPTIKDNLKHTPLECALSSVIKMLLKNAVEAWEEAKAADDKRAKELADEMAAAVAATNARSKTPERK